MCPFNTNIDLNFGFMLFFFFFFLIFVSYLNFLIPNFIFLITKTIFLFVYNLFVENLGIKYISFLPFILYFFIFFLFSNVIGMIPFVFTITSHFCITFSIAYSILFCATYLGIKTHGTKFTNLFIPSGCPLLIIPFIILIELISYAARMFSLSIRLFANMMSGHTLLHILSKFAWNILFFGVFGFLSLIFPAGFLSIITLLELSIACLQAYVFVILIVIYFNDVINLH